MFTNGYTQKHAIQDALRFVAYRALNPTAEVTPELLEAEARLRALNSGELLDAFGAALRSGITPGITPVVTVTADKPPSATKPRRPLGRNW